MRCNEIFLLASFDSRKITETRKAEKVTISENNDNYAILTSEYAEFISHIYIDIVR